MSQQSIMGRITSLARANIDALLDQAEDPRETLDRMIRDYTGAISDTEGAIAQTIGDLRLMEDDAREDQALASQWGGKALDASRRADELRRTDAAGADRFDGLARIALRNQISDEADAKMLAATIADQSALVERLEEGLEDIRLKLDDLRRKRDEPVGRAQDASAMEVRAAGRPIDVLDPSREIARFEEKVRREEARIRGDVGLGASSLDAQWGSLDTDVSDTEVEARLRKLKPRD